jgi:hypothetical protein
LVKIELEVVHPGQFIAIAASTSVAEDNTVIPTLPLSSPIMILIIFHMV